MGLGHMKCRQMQCPNKQCQPEVKGTQDHLT